MSEHKNIPVTLGSLFDGIGGFPYAASFFGIEALWASEILPAAVSVTRRHLPSMEHVGDITKLHGGTLPPVDIITFGSPCQGLSAAGKRKGLADPRSGLFLEAIRIIQEMREATNGKYPTWAVWENVPGAMSSNRGHDFKAVLEAFTESEIPFPRSGRWANAGMVRSRSVDVAWCVYNAQHFGTAQRRRRIFLVCDFGGRRAGEILFVPKSLQGYFAAGGTPRQGSAAYAVRGSDGASVSASVRDTDAPIFADCDNQCGGNACGHNGGHFALSQRPDCLTPWDTQQARIYTDGGKAATLAGADGGGGRNPGGLIFASGVVSKGDGDCFITPERHMSLTAGGGQAGQGYPCVMAATLSSCGASPSTERADDDGVRNHGEIVYTAGFCAGAGAKANGIGYEEECAPTLKGGACGFQMPTVLCAAFMGDSSPSSYGIEYSEETAPTLKPRLSGTPCLCEPKLARTLTARGDGSPNVDSGPNIVTVQCPLSGAVGVHQNQDGDVHTANTAYSLATTGNASSRNAPLVCTRIHAYSLDGIESNSMKSSNPASGCREVETARTIDTTNPCPSKNQGGLAIVQPITAERPVLCAATAQANAEICEELCPTITEAAGTSGNNRPYIVHPDVSGTLCASGAGLSRPAGMASETDLCVAYCIQGNMIGRADHNGPKGNGVNKNISFTLNCVDHHAVAKADKPAPIPINDKATRFSGGGDTRNDDGAGNGLGVGQPGDPAPTLTSGDRHAVATVFRQQRSDAYHENEIASTQTAHQSKDATDLVCTAVDCRNFRESRELSGTLQAKENGSYSLNYQNPVRMGYIVRRLTPTECERLQGYPDGWTAFGHDGKPISDTARYMMEGNSVAVPCVAYILMGIEEAHRREDA